MSVFSLQDYFRGQRHRLLDDNIGGELIPNRLNHALQINASLVDLVDKDNGGNVHFPQGMEQNTGLGLHAIFSGDHQEAPSKTAKERYTSAKKSMWPGVSTMLTLHLCHWKEVTAA